MSSIVIFNNDNIVFTKFFSTKDNIIYKMNIDQKFTFVIELLAAVPIFLFLVLGLDITVFLQPISLNQCNANVAFLCSLPPQVESVKLIALMNIYQKKRTNKNQPIHNPLLTTKPLELFDIIIISYNSKKFDFMPNLLKLETFYSTNLDNYSNFNKQHFSTNGLVQWQFFTLSSI